MRTMGLLVCVIGLSFGQSSSRPTFDVSAVRMYPAGSTVAPGVQGFQKSPDGFRAIHVTLRGCLQWAYSIVDVDGPAWITDESYDITAKAARPVPDPAMRQMMQTLLEQRFQIRVGRLEVPGGCRPDDAQGSNDFGVKRKPVQGPAGASPANVFRRSGRSGETLLAVPRRHF